ncbi:MAG: iron ABC transporter permease [Bacilli bacterium]|jgi:iron complex transport system permease protein|nr:iron ABC transporter permease [Bacilli bacterium]MCH4228614.1 iron ABC transporter permease [Bacilli bacterium]
MSENKQLSVKRKWLILLILFIIALFLSVACLFVGSSNMSLSDGFAALFKQGSDSNIRIIWNIRIPRILAAIIAGAGLAVSGLIMQTSLGNAMASPSTLGVSNAAVFGANVSIVIAAGGYLSTGNNLSSYTSGINLYSTSLVAFLFSAVSVLLILGLCKLRSFSPNAVVLAGVAIGSIWSAATTILQYYATDVGLSAAVIWTFGDLGRATYSSDLIMAVVIFVSSCYFMFSSWKYNALLSGDEVARSVGVSVEPFRFVSLLLASLITAVCVSFLGVIGFVGIIAPHVMKKILGQDHRFLIPASILGGIILVVLADTVSRAIGNGSALPVGAITSLIGGPFFLYIIFSKKRAESC